MYFSSCKLCLLSFLCLTHFMKFSCRLYYHCKYTYAIRFPNSTCVLVQVNQIFNLHNCLLFFLWKGIHPEVGDTVDYLGHLSPSMFLQWLTGQGHIPVLREEKLQSLCAVQSHQWHPVWFTYSLHVLTQSAYLLSICKLLLSSSKWWQRPSI